MHRTAKRRLVDLAAALLLASAATTSIQKLIVASRSPLAFDDAYMFLRYAHNIRHGLGFSWNLDAAHTYGPTSLLWSFCVLLLSYLPTTPWTQLILGSWLFSIAAVIAIAWAVAANAQSDWLRSTLRVLPLIVVPLASTAVFCGNQFNGMETMLATTLCGLFAGLTLLWRQGRTPPALVGVCGLLLFLARPESAIITLFLPSLLWLLLEGPRPARKSLFVLYTVFFSGVIIELLACRLYFGTPLPLSVYMKGHQAYLGYSSIWYPSLLLIAFLSATQLFLAALILLARRRDLRPRSRLFPPRGSRIVLSRHRHPDHGLQQPLLLPVRPSDHHPRAAGPRSLARRPNIRARRVAQPHAPQSRRPDRRPHPVLLRALFRIRSSEVAPHARLP